MMKFSGIASHTKDRNIGPLKQACPVPIGVHLFQKTPIQSKMLITAI